MGMAGQDADAGAPIELLIDLLPETGPGEHSQEQQVFTAAPGDRFLNLCSGHDLFLSV